MARAGKAKPGGATPAIRVLEADGAAFTVLEYRHDPATPSYGEEAAEALSLDPSEVFKTLVADVDGRLVVGVVPVAGQLDLKALAAAVGGKRAVMADPAAAQRSSGYVLGGISPLGQRTALPTVVDSSALTLVSMCVSAGRRGLEVRLAPGDLIRLTGAVTAAVGRLS